MVDENLIFKNRDIISITDFSSDEIIYLCKKAEMMQDLEKSGRRYELRSVLKNRKMAYMFYEPSTRTKLSFDTAMGQLGGKRDGFSGSEGTSVKKKECIRDTVKMMEANHFDVIVMRNPMDGSLQWAADVAQIPVINCGDGKNEHPTQSLLDIFTLYSFNNQKLDGISLGFGGDLSHGRTVKSLSLALSHFKDITIRWAAKDFLGMPQDMIDLLESRGVNVIRENTVEEVMEKVDFYYMTRPQLERMKNIDEAEMIKIMDEYRIDLEKIKNFKGKLMHPLPVNSEIQEIECGVFFSSCQGFYQQAENGIFMRKALLYELLTHENYINFHPNLSKELLFGNNRLKRDIKDELKSGLFIDNIPGGVVVDHLKFGTSRDVSVAFNLIDRGFISIPSDLPPTTQFLKGKSFLKTNLNNLTERELKKLTILSEESTVNIIKEGKIVDKFVYLLCNNGNCVTRQVNEDVPPKFYNANGIIRCRYCRKSYNITNSKISAEEKKAYLNSLPNCIDIIKP